MTGAVIQGVMFGMALGVAAVTNVRSTPLALVIVTIGSILFGIAEVLA